MKTCAIILGSLLTFAFFGITPARAAAISNLTEEAYTFTLYDIGTSKPRYVTVQPGATYHTPGDVRVVMNGFEYTLEYRDEYSLWPGGKFGPQRRTRNNNSGVSR